MTSITVDPDGIRTLRYTAADLGLPATTHPDIVSIRAQQANMRSHACRLCWRADCFDGDRETHDAEWSRPESARLMPERDYYFCPLCGGDVRTALPCVNWPAADNLLDAIHAATSNGGWVTSAAVA